MIIKIELTESILNVLTTAQKDEILRGLITDLKESVDLRIEKIKAELGDTRTAIVTPRGDKIIYTSEEKAELIKRVKEDYKNGIKPADIALKYNLDWYTVDNILTVRPEQNIKSDNQVLESTPQKGGMVESHSATIKPDFHHGSQHISDSVIAAVQKKYNEGNRSLMMLMNQDYPDIKYRTIYGHIKLKKKLKK